MIVYRIIKRAGADDIRSRAYRGKKMVTIKRAGAEDIRSRAHRGSKIVRIKRADAEDIRSRARRGRTMTTITGRAQRIYDQAPTEA